MNKSNAINVLTTSTIAIKPISPKNYIKNENDEENFPLKDKKIQCNLLQAPLCLELRVFSIEDKNKRKFLLRAIFGWIILQNFIYMPLMYLFLQNLSDFSKKISLNTTIMIINFSVSAILYKLRDFRRSTPNAIFSLIFVTALNSILMGLFSVVVNSPVFICQPLILICQLCAIILYSLQSKFDLTNLRAVIISTAFYTSSAYCISVAVYIVFDTQLMLTSPIHNYQMAENEHIFGAVNLYADQSRLAWLLFRCFFLDSTITSLRIAYKTLTSKLY